MHNYIYHTIKCTLSRDLRRPTASLPRPHNLVTQSLLLQFAFSLLQIGLLVALVLSTLTLPFTLAFLNLSLALDLQLTFRTPIDIHFIIIVSGIAATRATAVPPTLAASIPAKVFSLRWSR